MQVWDNNELLLTFKVPSLHFVHDYKRKEGVIRKTFELSVTKGTVAECQILYVSGKDHFGKCVLKSDPLKFERSKASFNFYKNTGSCNLEIHFTVGEQRLSLVTDLNVNFKGRQPPKKKSYSDTDENSDVSPIDLMGVDALDSIDADVDSLLSAIDVDSALYDTDVDSPLGWTSSSSSLES